MKNQIILGLYMCLISVLNAQVKVGDNPTTFNANSILELESTNKGLLLPRLALTATNSASPLSAFVQGMLVYNTATAGAAPNNVVPGFYFNNGTRWVRVGDALDASKWRNNNTNLRIELTNLSDGTTARAAGRQFVITDAGSVGIGTAAPHSSSILDLTSTTSGFLPPRMINGQMKDITSPANGLTIYNTTLNCLAYHVNGSFNCIQNFPAQPAPTAPLGSTYSSHFNGIVSGTSVNNTLSTYTSGETFNQNTTCTSKVISAQGCGGLTQVIGASGTVYPLVNINGQCWMRTNLKEVPSNFESYTNTSWLATSPGDLGYWGYYNTSTTNGTAGWRISEPAASEGLLYQWSAAMDNSESERSRGICPVGFHIPSDCEWMYLEHGQGMSIADQSVGSAWRSNTNDNEGTPGYKLRSQGAGNTNTSGFAALLAGSRGTNGVFDARASDGHWWSSTAGSTSAFGRVLRDGNRGVMRYSGSKAIGFSVRCLKD